MKITNWETWQTFRKDRGTPPWIKVYRNLMTNEEWVSLSDSEKGQLVSIWILAADKNGTIPDNPKAIQRMAMLDAAPNLNKLINLGFLTVTCQPSGNQVVTIPPEVDAPEKSRGETEKSKKQFTPPTLQEVTAYCTERSNRINPGQFINHYEANGWMRGKNKIKDWKACIRTWEQRDENSGQPSQDTRSRAQRVSDKLDDIARQDIEENGFTSALD